MVFGSLIFPWLSDSETDHLRVHKDEVLGSRDLQDFYGVQSKR